MLWFIALAREWHLRRTLSRTRVLTLGSRQIFEGIVLKANTKLDNQVCTDWWRMISPLIHTLHFNVSISISNNLMSLLSHDVPLLTWCHQAKQKLEILVHPSIQIATMLHYSSQMSFHCHFLTSLLIWWPCICNDCFTSATTCYIYLTYNGISRYVMVFLNAQHPEHALKYETLLTPPLNLGVGAFP